MRADMKEGIVSGGGVEKDDDKLDPFVSRIQYHAMNFDDASGYDSLKETLAGIDAKFGTKGNRLFYLATAPEYFSDIIKFLGDHCMARPRDCGDGQNWVRIIIEKPFGHDLESARALNDEVNKVFDENQIFRIDHYLGKETVQNILVFRFANGIFENVWNRNYIDHVEITAAESIGIEGRGPFYETAGALRDVVQNHVMELAEFCGDGAAGFVCIGCGACGEGEGLEGDYCRYILRIRCADSMGRGLWTASQWWATGRRTVSIRDRRRRHMLRCGWRLRTGAGRGFRSTFARASGWRSG